jgi:hypothetical protein
MVFNRHILEASYCYKKFGLEWSFKYSKNTMIFKIEFLHAYQTPLSKNTMVLFNILVLSQNFKNIFPNTH